VAEGRRVLGNIERVASLFLTKTVYAVLLAMATAVVGFAATSGLEGLRFAVPAGIAAAAATFSSYVVARLTPGGSP